ncbi:MAG: acetylxylan esterase [Eubacteriales bacterium]
MKKIWFTLLTFVLLCGVLVSCGNKDVKDAPDSDGQTQNLPETEPDPEISYTEGQEVVIADANGCEFTVVRPGVAAPKIISAANTVCAKISEITGKEITTVKDSDGKNGYEILIGSTSRAESVSASEGLDSNTYRILFKSSRIVIVGGSDNATEAAVNKFIELFVSEDCISVPFGTDYSESSAPKLLVGDNNLSDYKIYAGDALPECVTRVSDAIYKCTGVSPETSADQGGKDDKIIEFAVDTTLDEGSYFIKASDNRICLSAPTRIGLLGAVKAFEKALDGKNESGQTYNLDLTFHGSINAFEGAGGESTSYFLCSTNKDALSYEIGEEMVIDIYLMSRGELVSCSEFDWSITGDDGSKSSGKSSGANGVLTLKTSLSCDGFVYILVKALDSAGNEIDNTVRFSGGTGVHPEKLKTTVEEPADFDEFWEKSIAELYKVQPDIIEMEEVNMKDGYKTYKMKLECLGDPKWTGETYVSGYLTYPTNASQKSLSLSLSFEGYGVRCQKPQYNSTGAVFTVYTHSIEVGMDDSYYTSLSNGALKSYGWSETENANPENVYFRYMILRDLQALRFMKQYFGPDGNNLWSGKSITVGGGSQGGFQTLAIAALDHDVTEANANIPWLCDIGGYTDGKRLKSSFRPNYVSGLSYFDSASFASRIECRITINAGLGDTCCPPAGVFAMYNALKCPKTMTMRQNKTHSYTPSVGDVFTFSGN